VLVALLTSSCARACAGSIVVAAGVCAGEAVPTLVGSVLIVSLSCVWPNCSITRPEIRTRVPTG
jgi:hypothetical protein